MEIYDDLPESYQSKLAEPLNFTPVMVLDKWLGNTDVRQGSSSASAGTAFPDLALHGVYHRNHVYEGITGWESFEPTLTKAEGIGFLELWRLAQMIPSDWYDR